MGILVALIGVASSPLSLLLLSLPFSEVSSEENWKTKKNKKGGCEKFNRVFHSHLFIILQMFLLTYP